MTAQEHDLMAELSLMRAELHLIHGELAELRGALPVVETLTVSEIARRLGVAVSTLYKPWNLPNFGRSDLGNSPRRWLREKALGWYARPESERRAEWEALPAHERAALGGM